MATSHPSPRGQLAIASCRSGTYLATSVAAAYPGDQDRPLTLLTDLDDNFSDSETIVRLQHDVSGKDVFLFQALYDPTSARSIDQNYMAFFIAARAFREWGANYVTAVLPYLAYARQDKPAPFAYEPTTAKLTADFAATAGIDRLVTWHPSLRQIHGFYGGMPVHVLDALGFFAHRFRDLAGRSDVVAVAPDVGASKFVTHLGRTLDLSCAIASKYRPQPEHAVVNEIIGNISGRKIALVIDDMISTGGTIAAVVQRLAEAGIAEIIVGVSHNLCQPVAHERLRTLHENYNLSRLIVTNTIPQTQPFRDLPFLEVYDLSDLFARAVHQIHHNQPLHDLYRFKAKESAQ
ncbi:MAG: ribose-phosphate diphosphokinase [Anaerolineae bacterium]|nr:ribose-phosphate diphosphokinase [Anaerolineae bacterium]